MSALCQYESILNKYIYIYDFIVLFEIEKKACYLMPIIRLKGKHGLHVNY